MGLLKKTDALTLAREAIALAEENAASAERTCRIVKDAMAEGQSIEVEVMGGGQLYAEVFSPVSNAVGTITLSDGDGVQVASKSVDARLAAFTFSLHGSGSWRVGFCAATALNAVKLSLSVKGGAFIGA